MLARVRRRTRHSGRTFKPPAGEIAGGKDDVKDVLSIFSRQVIASQRAQRRMSAGEQRWHSAARSMG